MKHHFLHENRDMMSLALFVDPKCKKEGTRILFQKKLHQKIIVFTSRTTIKVFTGWLTLRMSSTSRRIMIYPIIFLLGYYFIQVLYKYYKSFKKLTIASQINYQFETRLMCLALNLTDEGPTATTGSSGSGGSSDQTAGQTGGAPPLNMTDAPCYKDAQAKFGMWRARFYLTLLLLFLASYSSSFFSLP